jgi:hypothetical protein
MPALARKWMIQDIALFQNLGDAGLVGASRKRVYQVMVMLKNSGCSTVDEEGRSTVLDRKSLVRMCK